MNEQEPRHSNWTFLTNHAAVLIYIAGHPDDTVLQIAQACGLRERITAAIIADLREAGYIRVSRTGRHNHYAVEEDMPLRRQVHASFTIKSLISALSEVEAARS